MQLLETVWECDQIFLSCLVYGTFSIHCCHYSLHVVFCVKITELRTWIFVLKVKSFALALKSKYLLLTLSLLTATP